MIEKSWTTTLVAATLAVAFALVGLLATSLGLASPVLGAALLAGSLCATATAFGVLAARVHRLEMENLGLIEEISQQFDRVQDKIEIFADALREPRSLTPEAPGQAEPVTRLSVK